MGNNWEYLIKKRQYTYNQVKQFQQTYKVPMLFFIYDKYTGNFIKNRNNKYSFKYEDLVD